MPRMVRTRRGQGIFPTIFYRPLCVIRRPINSVLVRLFYLCRWFCTTVLSRKHDNTFIETVCYAAPKRRGAFAGPSWMESCRWNIETRDW